MEVASSMAELGGASDVVVSVLPNDAVLTEVIDSSLSCFKQGSVHV